jgi:hypothetical protein
VYPQFGWHAYDATSLLPDGWRKDILDVAATRAVRHELIGAKSVTSREEPGHVVTTWTVDPIVVAAELPWLTALYHGPLLKLAQIAFSDEAVVPAENPHYGCNLNVMRDGERYECTLIPVSSSFSSPKICRRVQAAS